MFFELAVMFECSEALHMDNLHPGESLPLATPQRHYLAAETVFLFHFSHYSQVVFELLDLILFSRQKGLAPAPLSVDRLFLLVGKAPFCLDELVHSWGPEPKDQLVKTLSKALSV